MIALNLKSDNIIRKAAFQVIVAALDILNDVKLFISNRVSIRV